MNIRYLLAPLVAVIMVLVSACGGGAVDAPEVDRPGYTTPTPETPAPPHGMIETPTTPDVPDEPYNGGNGADGQGANDIDDLEEPNQTDEPLTGGDIGRTRHVELRTAATTLTPSGITITGRGLGSLDREASHAHVREMAEDMNYAFASQLQGPDGSPVAKFTYHFYPDPDGAEGRGRHSSWITLDIKATGESILVLSADFNPRRAAPIVTFTGLGDHGGTRVAYVDFNQFLTDRGA